MNLRRVFKITFVILLLLGWGLFFVQFFKNKGYDQLILKNSYHGIRIYKEAPEFELTDQNNSRVSLSDFRGRLVLISWGFTNCPDICPLLLSKLNMVKKKLGDVGDNVQVLFITIDPERDTPGRLKSYVLSFNDTFIGLTGTPEEIKRVVEDYNAFFIKHPEVYGRGEFDTWASYQMSHTTNIYLVDRYGRLLFYYPYANLHPQDISEDIKKILKG